MVALLLFPFVDARIGEKGTGKHDRGQKPDKIDQGLRFRGDRKGGRTGRESLFLCAKGAIQIS
ncbi:MAG: hypothetical protein C0617_14300 [Desulfuromonas sp.]|nr:MAG: hypothetical protein C0617_14300 [Desulfuromonas sp.]